jgi:hypothetical protein
MGKCNSGHMHLDKCIWADVFWANVVLPSRGGSLSLPNGLPGASSQDVLRTISRNDTGSQRHICSSLAHADAIIINCPSYVAHVAMRTSFILMTRYEAKYNARACHVGRLVPDATLEPTAVPFCFCCTVPVAAA